MPCFACASSSQPERPPLLYASSSSHSEKRPNLLYPTAATQFLRQTPPTELRELSRYCSLCQTIRTRGLPKIASVASLSRPFLGGPPRLVPPLGNCVPRREYHVTSHGVGDFMRFNLMPCLLTYSRLIKSYATFTGWSCDLFYVPFNEKIRLQKKKSRFARK